MRRIGCVFVTAVVGLACPAFGGSPGCASCNGGAANAWAMRGLDAEACASPCGHVLAPGCCEDTRHCCDNAWAGYCEHRARVDAFWAKVGTPRSSDHRCYGRSVRGIACDTYSSSSPCHVSPLPAVTPTPAPATSPQLETAPLPPTPSDKASRATNSPRLR